MDTVVRCLIVLPTLKVTLRAIATAAGGTGGIASRRIERTNVVKTQMAEASGPGSDPESDVEFLWSEIEAAASRRRRCELDKDKSGRLEKAKIFRRLAQAGSATNSRVKMSPQRNRFRVTELSGHRSPPPLPPEPPYIPLPPSDTGEANPTKTTSKLRAASVKSFSSTTFLSAKVETFLQEARRTSSSSSTARTYIKAAAVTRQREKNRLEKVRTWVNTGLGDQLLTRPWVGAGSNLT